MDSRIVVYTCITAGYDDILPIQYPEDGLRYVCFTDMPGESFRGWEVLPLPRPGLDPVTANRYAKMHPHLLFPDHSLSLYVDGNVQLVSGVRTFVDESLKTCALALFAHPWRDCIYKEGAKLAFLGFDAPRAFYRQLSRYRLEGMPQGAGLYECNVLPRAHHDPGVRALMEAWWWEFSMGVKRDQISLPYLLWKRRIPVQVLPKSRIRVDDLRFRMHIAHKGISWRRALRGIRNRFTIHYWLLRLSWYPSRQVNV